VSAPATQLASLAATKRTASIVRDQVLEAITSFGSEGLTSHECAAVLDIVKETVQPRISELHTEGRVRDSGQRRLNASGKKAIVWVVA